VNGQPNHAEDLQQRRHRLLHVHLGFDVDVTVTVAATDTPLKVTLSSLFRRRWSKRSREQLGDADDDINTLSRPRRAFPSSSRRSEWHGWQQRCVHGHAALHVTSTPRKHSSSIDCRGGFSRSFVGCQLALIGCRFIGCQLAALRIVGLFTSPTNDN